MDAAGVGVELDASLGRVSKAITAAIKDALTEVRDYARAEHDRTATIVPGSDKRFSNWPEAPLSIGAKVEGDELKVSPRGAWGLAEGGRAAGPMKAWGHPARHPGTARTQGRKVWSQARDRILAAAEESIPSTIDDGIEGAV